MLRITRINHAHSSPTIKLEGKLLGPWVEEMSQAFAAASSATQPVSLDLSALSYADAAGVTLLRELVDRQATIIACSGYVAQLLNGDQP